MPLMTAPTDPIFPILLPEVILAVAACALFILGASIKASSRKLAPALALVALATALLASVLTPASESVDAFGSFRITPLSPYIRVLATGVAGLFVLLAWPSDREGSGNRSISLGTETSEYFALLILAVLGILVVASADNLASLFLGIELASIPTYVMVTMSRPIEVAQEAGVKYFFLGAAAAAIMLFGISYLYGTTGLTNLTQLGDHFNRAGNAGQVMPRAQLLAVVLMIVGFGFKLAAVPMHFYAGDVYQGAATPVTALLSFVPKTTGVLALIKLLVVLGGGVTAVVPPEVGKLLWVLAVLTMTVGNVLGLLQYNVKRVLAYSSVAHSGYLLMGLAVYALSPDHAAALRAVLFYLAAYGLMNTGAFGVLMLLPSRTSTPATTAETYDDLAGSARARPLLGLAMAVACLSLIGIPFTVGFWGKLYLIRAALGGGSTLLVWLAVITMLNALISAAYYLKIIATMWMRAADEPDAPRLGRPSGAPAGDGFGDATAAAPLGTRDATAAAGPAIAGPAATGPATAVASPAFVGERSLPISLAVGLSVFGVLLLGIVAPLLNWMIVPIYNAAIALGR